MKVEIRLLFSLVLLVGVCYGDWANVYFGLPCKESNPTIIYSSMTGRCIPEYGTIIECDYENNQVIWKNYNDPQCTINTYNTTYPFDTCYTNKRAYVTCSVEQLTFSNPTTQQITYGNCKEDTDPLTVTTSFVDQCFLPEWYGEWSYYSCNATYLTIKNYIDQSELTSSRSSSDYDTTATMSGETAGILGLYVQSSELLTAGGSSTTGNQYHNSLYPPPPVKSFPKYSIGTNECTEQYYSSTTYTKLTNNPTCKSGKTFITCDSGTPCHETEASVIFSAVSGVCIPQYSLIMQCDYENSMVVWYSFKDTACTELLNMYSEVINECYYSNRAFANCSTEALTFTKPHTQQITYGDCSESTQPISITTTFIDQCFMDEFYGYWSMQSCNSTYLTIQNYIDQSELTSSRSTSDSTTTTTNSITATLSGQTAGSSGYYIPPEKSTSTTGPLEIYPNIRKPSLASKNECSQQYYSSTYYIELTVKPTCINSQTFTTCSPSSKF
ncbi:hypothetical protein DLAC_00794 [Tieghemostelium lacteum]|uniref:Uncharacterized protein n=1 Tax=Tieghemostelium lacteum TaxID=361077 RepID=A0A152A7A5_TIELA|nr:hypothetical protein DLAC_00794 [Tieghemostelium lacteum]|eukprot:KYR02001.1 hypothetical protein DLAC_00794 [Tieghemostelium lacteum]